jgi:hypothetical protein
MAGKYRCKCCNTTLVPLEDLEVQVGPAFWDAPGFVCINCDYLIGEDEIVRGINDDPNYDIEEATDAEIQEGD